MPSTAGLCSQSGQPAHPPARGYMPAGDANLFLVDNLGGTVTQLTEDQGSNNQPAWQPVF